MKRTALALAILAFVPLSAWPQATTDSWDNLKQLRPGQKIQVVDIHVRTLKGEFVALTDDTISFRDGQKELSVAKAEVVRVSLRDTSRRTGNMLLGSGIAGGIALAVAIPLWKQQSNEGNNCAACAIAVAGGFGGGAALGATYTYRTLYRVKR